METALVMRLCVSSSSVSTSDHLLETALVMRLCVSSSSVSTSDRQLETALVCDFVYLYLQLVPVIVYWKPPLVMRLYVSSSSVSTSDCLLENAFGNVTLCTFIFS